MPKRLEIIFIIMTIVSYLFSLTSFLWLDSRFFLSAFVIQGAFLILVTFLSLRPDPALAEAEQRIKSIKAEWGFETEELKKQLSTKEDALTALQEELAATEQKNAGLTGQLKELEALSALAPKKSEIFLDDANMETDMSILPQFLPKPGESAPVNIVDIAKTVAKEFHDVAMKAGLSIHITAAEKNLMVKADSNMLRILFRNIVDNSVKYMFEQGSVIITISSVGDDIFIVCKDTGKGLHPSETAHVFELNFQGSNRISGNGLGLYQAQAIVSYYGGTIFAKSNLGQGMGIYIQLPSK